MFSQTAKFNAQSLAILVNLCTCLLHWQILHFLILQVHRNPSCHGKVIIGTHDCLTYIVYLIAWDLLRINVYGFRAFCNWFLQTYPTYFIVPLRLSGSAVESLFSQYKHNSRGKLDSVNYTTARAAHLVKQSVSAHHSGKGYRDETLNKIEIPLRKKTYNKSTHTKNDE